MKYSKCLWWNGKRGDSFEVYGIQWSDGDIETWDDPSVAREMYESLTGNDRRRAKLVVVKTTYLTN